MPPVENDITDMIGEADKIGSLITTARRLLDDNKMVDLSALEGRVAGLCLSVEGVPERETGPVRKALETILADLDMLAADLTRQHETVRRGDSGGDLKRAVRAYGRDE